jgi:hypothetical protein
MLVLTAHPFTPVLVSVKAPTAGSLRVGVAVSNTQSLMLKLPPAGLGQTSALSQ